MEEQTLKGTKFDDNKLRVSEFLKDFLLPIIEVIKVWQYGAEVHGVGNWKKVDNGYKRFSNALNRHLLKSEFECCDEETGIMHEAHIAWNALTMIYFKIKERGAYNIKANMQYPVAVPKARININPPLGKTAYDREPKKYKANAYNPLIYYTDEYIERVLMERTPEEIKDFERLDKDFAEQLKSYKERKLECRE